MFLFFSNYFLLLFLKVQCYFLVLLFYSYIKKTICSSITINVLIFKEILSFEIVLKKEMNFFKINFFNLIKFNV